MGATLSSAKGIEQFDTAIFSGYLPSESSIEYEGLLYEYYFKTPQTDKLFDISLSYGFSPDPLSLAPEHYLSIGLGSKYDGDGLRKHSARPKLNLVICLDNSGSMAELFSGPDSLDKMTVAKNSLLVLLNKLRPDDMFGLVTFNTTSTIIHPLQLWKDTNVAILKEKIMNIVAFNGTQLSQGMDAAAKMCESGSPENQNRIIFLTDMLVSSNEEKELYENTRKYVLNKTYFTYIGVGIDFNSDLVGKLSKLRNTNYMSVKNSKDFKRKMDEDFDYLVTPVVYDVSVSFDTTAWKVERVFGSPGFEHPEDGKLAQMDSVFPTPEDENNPGSTKGGIILVKLTKLKECEDPIKFRLEYVDTVGNKFSEEHNFAIPQATSENFDNNSIQKGIALSRFVSFMKNYLRSPETPQLSTSSGIIVPTPLVEDEKNKRSLAPINFSQEWKPLFCKFEEGLLLKLN